MERNKTALMTAAEILARQEQSSEHLRKKLLIKKYNEEEISEAIKILQERKYLNDEESCRRQFEYLYSEKKLSVGQICMKLIQRGYDSEFVKSLISEDSDEHDLTVAKKIFEKKFAKKNSDIEDAKEKFKFKQKVYQHLAMKGFTTEIISSIMEMI